MASLHWYFRKGPKLSKKTSPLPCDFRKDQKQSKKVSSKLAILETKAKKIKFHENHQGGPVLRNIC